MFDPNLLHPFPRYGFAAAAKRFTDEQLDLSSESGVRRLAQLALMDVLTGYMLKPETTEKPGAERVFVEVSAEQLNPGSKYGQNAANGYFTAPHVLTSNNAAEGVKEIKKLLSELKKKKLPPSYELKRSISPLVSKINAGKTSMSNPRVDIYTAAFTAVAMATKLKAAVYDYDLGGNVGLIPDLPYHQKQENDYPLTRYLWILDRLLLDAGHKKRIGTYDESSKKYPRPPIFRGNFQHSPVGMDLGSVALLSAIGKWMETNRMLYPEETASASSVLSLMADRPLYLISYEGSRQESFGHHLVKLAESGRLYELTKDLPKVDLPGQEANKKFSSTEWAHFRRRTDHFLRFFTTASFRDFLATRAVYPSSFLHLFKQYFMRKPELTQEIIDSAMAYGKTLNSAAYFTALREHQGDEKTDRSIYDYKNRILTQFESTVRSAKSGAALLSQMSTIVGRLTQRDFPNETETFYRVVSLENAPGGISLDQAKELITAFMRLNLRPERAMADESVELSSTPPGEAPDTTGDESF